MPSNIGIRATSAQLIGAEYQPVTPSTPSSALARDRHHQSAATTERPSGSSPSPPTAWMCAVACDVIEDFLRIYGYNNIADAQRFAPLVRCRTRALTDCRRRPHADRGGRSSSPAHGLERDPQQLADGRSLLRRPRPTSRQPTAVHLLNPLSQDLNVMRQTLLFGGLESIAHNVNRRNRRHGVSSSSATSTSLQPRQANPTRRSVRSTPYCERPASGPVAGRLDIRRANWLRAAEEAAILRPARQPSSTCIMLAPA